MQTTNTGAIGNRLKNIKDLLSPRNSDENGAEEGSESSSSGSCTSVKIISQAWKNRAKSLSTMNLNTGGNNFQMNLGEVPSMIAAKRSTGGCDKDYKLARRVSLSVLVERRSLRLTDSSDEDQPQASMKPAKRFFTPDEIRDAFTAFKMYDANDDDYIGLNELKLALEKLSVPQTHLAAKEFMDEIAGRHAKKMNFYQFMLTYTAILEGTKPQKMIQSNSNLDLGRPKESTQISPSFAQSGVGGVKLFFETKIAQQSPDLAKKRT